MLQGKGGGGSKMRVRRDRGSFWAPCAAQGGRRERLKSLLPAARERPGDPKKFMWRLLRASWGGKLIDFSFREGGQENLPESIFEASFLGAPPGTKQL